MWKIKWSIKVLLQSDLYRKIRTKFANPFIFHYLLLTKLLNDRSRQVRVKLTNGQTIFVYRFMDLFKLYEIFLEEIYRFDFIDKSVNSIVDIGANKGYYTIWQSEKYPQAKYYCYEPASENLSKLEHQLSASRINSVVYREGVSGKAGSGKLFLDKKNDGAHSLYGNPSHHSETINLIDINEVLNRIDQKQIGLMKIDCEGAEKDIILSLKEEHAARIKYLMFETTPSLYKVDLLVNHLQKIGFSIYQDTGIIKAYSQNKQ